MTSGSGASRTLSQVLAQRVNPVRRVYAYVCTDCGHRNGVHLADLRGGEPYRCALCDCESMDPPMEALSKQESDRYEALTGSSEDDECPCGHPESAHVTPEAQARLSVGRSCRVWKCPCGSGEERA